MDAAGPPFGPLGVGHRKGDTVLHRRRKRLEELARKEAAGEIFWTTKFDGAFRNKVLLGFRVAGDQWVSHYATVARLLIMEDEGLLYLVSAGEDSVSGLLNFLLQCADEMVPTVIEAMYEALGRSEPYGSFRLRERQAFAQVVVTALREHRISYDFVDGEMIEFSSQELHVAVVAPTLRLLSGRMGFDEVEKAYKEALDEIAKDKPENAITDAGTALQEMLEALGCDGNSLGPLIKSAKKKNLFAVHDSHILDSCERTMTWVSADRSEKGDAHSATGASIEDAWLMVHVVGALILRLSQGSRGGA